jgi:hypothetical protein
MNTPLQAPGAADLAPRQIQSESAETKEANAPNAHAFQEKSRPSGKPRLFVRPMRSRKRPLPEGKDSESLLKRVELRATEEFLTALDGLALKENLSRADIIRRGVGLYARMIVEKEKGRYFAVVAVENNGLAVKEVVQP